MGQNEETESGAVTVTVPEQTAILEKLRVMQVQIDELKHNMDREVSRRVKNTFESNTELKLEVRNLRADLTDQRASNKAVTAERDKLHGELVDVRSALAAATEERDSLRTTLEAWEQADTKPHRRVAADDVADHVVPPVLKLCKICHGCGSTLVPNDESRSLWHCRNTLCARRNTGWDSPFEGPCKSTTPVRHE